MGEKIASFSQPAVAMAKETVNASYELSLAVSICYSYCYISTSLLTYLMTIIIIGGCKI